MPVYAAEIRIDAPPGRVWAVWADVLRWPRWTPTVERVEHVDGPEGLGLGARYRIVQPKLQPAVWTVTRAEPGLGFDWQASTPGLQMSAEHQLEPDGDGTRLRQRVVLSGLLSAPVGWFYGALSQRYVEQEAQGLKAVCEGPG